MRLLFEQNLSPRLPKLLGDLFPSSIHVREVGLQEVEDKDVWEHAKLHGFAVVSKDSDFQQRSLLLGAPPKFIWLRLGNCSVPESAMIIRVFSAAIHTFDADPAHSHLMLP